MKLQLALAALMAAGAASAATCPPGQRCPTSSEGRPAPSREAAPSRPAAPAYRQGPPAGRPTGQILPGPQGGPPIGGQPAYRRTFQNGGASQSGQSAGQRYQGRGPGYPGQGAGHVYGAERHFNRPTRDTRGRRFYWHGRSYSAFRAGPYRWPRGYGYHRFFVHQFLPRLFWIPDYYIDDWADYGVYAPPYDTQWIRYGPDLVLVNLDTGEILDVVPGVFVDDYADQGPPPNDQGYDQGPPPGYGQGPPQGFDQESPDDQGPPPSPY